MELASIDGDLREQYNKLWHYEAELRRLNPGSIVEIKCEAGSLLKGNLYSKDFIVV